MKHLRFLALALSAGFFIGVEPGEVRAAGNTAPESSSNNLIHQLDHAFVEVFEKVAPTVVVIEADRKTSDDAGDADSFDSFFHAPQGPGGRAPGLLDNPIRSEGSGFIVRQDGYILTNNHVISDADEIGVRLKDGRRFTAKVIGSDDKTDIAVIKIDATSLPVAVLGDSDALKVGQIVCAIGVPFKLDYSFTCGWVSAKGRSKLTDTAYEDYIQTDAFINPGNSGGPLFDVDGNIVGMNTLINGIGRGLAFAIPSNMLKSIGDQLIAAGRIVRPWLGISMETLSESFPLKDRIPGIDKGVVIETIELNTPASKSDLRPLDVITQVDGVNLDSAANLQSQVLSKKVGQSIELTIWRAGKIMKIALTTEEMPSDLNHLSAAPPKPAPEPEGKENLYGLQLQDLNKGLADELKLQTTSGAIVTDVAPNSPAALEVQREDVITDVDSKPVKNAQECRDLINKNDGKKGVLLFIDRKGQKMYAVLKAER